VIGGDAVHVASLIGHASEEIPAAYDDRKLHSKLVHVGEFGGNFVDALGVDTEALIRGQGFSGKFQQNAFEGRGSHK
jgi:hypothetical protein